MPWNDNSGNGGGADDAPKANGGPWGSGSGGNGGGDGGSPWGRGGSGGNKGGPDLEEQMKRMQERFSRRGNGGGRRGRGGPSFGPGGFLLLGVAAIVAWLATGVVIVDEGERAAVFRFGEYQRNFAPGIHVHLPAPIETHEVLPSEEQQETTIGNNSGERLMLTSDENIVDVRFKVFWIYNENPEAFILNVDHDAPGNGRGSYLVKAAAESVMREVVGKSTLDAVITSGRAEVQTNVRAQLQELLDDYDAGVRINRIDILEALNPGPVQEAFDDVIKAGQDAERLVQVANQFANDIVPRARGDAQRILQEAQAYRDQVIADATGQADRFKLILAEYRRAPQVTRERMYLETMEKVLNRTDKLILDSDSGAVPYLPLDRVNRSGGN